MPKLPPALRPEAAEPAADPAALLERDEAFFAALAEDDPAFRLPFADPARVAAALADLSSLFAALRPAAGQAVLDLNCGTGWLTRILARLGLTVIACDAAPSALAKAEAAIRREEPALLDRITFLRSPDGVAIPLEEGAVTRAVMHGGLRRLPDRAGALRELARVLDPAGRAVVIEAAAHHAEGASPRDRLFARDIRLEEVAREAQDAGFAALEMALGLAEPAFVPLPVFQRQEARVAAGRAAAAEDLRLLGSRYDAFLSRARHLVLVKPGETADTREAAGYRRFYGPPGRIEILSVTHQAQRLVFEVALVNTSTLRWLPRGAGTGAVTIGVRLVTDPTEEGAELRRIRFATEPTPPGGRREARFSLPLPEPGSHYALDLVAEDVCWFGAPVTGEEKQFQALPAR